jgi:hypothetical protein
MSKLLQMSAPTSSFFAPRSQRPTTTGIICRYFGTPKGCVNGDACRYQHDTPSNRPITTVGGTNQVDQLGYPGEVVTREQIAALEHRLMGGIDRLTKAANAAVATNTRHHITTRQVVAAVGAATQQAVVAVGVETRQAVEAVGASIASNHADQMRAMQQNHIASLAADAAAHDALMARLTKRKLDRKTDVEKTDVEKKRAEILENL